MPIPTSEQVTDACTYHGEGAVSFPDGTLRFVDMLNGDVLSLDTETMKVTREHLGDVLACVRPRTAGGMVAALERGFLLVDPDGTRTELPALWVDPNVRMNEGGCDPDGRFYGGSMAYDQMPGAASVYRLNTDHTVDAVMSKLTISNGFGFTGDGDYAFHIDSTTQKIKVFNYGTHSGLTDPRVLVHIDPSLGMPDGLTVDSEDYVWVALWGGGAVHRYSPSGRLDCIITVPVTQVTSCALGGPELTRLFITTSRQKPDSEAEPSAGALFAVDVTVPGRPTLAYSG
jgi:sugar lactone lactonase YvrE